MSNEFDVSFALARTPERFKIKCRESAAGKEKLRTRGIYTSLRIDKAQTSSAVSTSKDEIAFFVVRQVYTVRIH